MEHLLSSSATCTLAAPSPAACTLPPRAALTLRPARSGLLRVTAGGLWATFDGPHPGPANEQGDHLLNAGTGLAVRAGRRVVIEALDPDVPARFTWEPLPASHNLGREPSEVPSNRAH